MKQNSNDKVQGDLKNPTQFYFHSKDWFLNLNVELDGNTIHLEKIKMPKLTICGYLEGLRLSFGVALCEPCDNYNKKVGRKISTGRAVQKPYKVINLKQERCYDIFMRECKEIEKELLTTKINQDFGPSIASLVNAHFEKEIANLDNH